MSGGFLFQLSTLKVMGGNKYTSSEERTHQISLRLSFHTSQRDWRMNEEEEGRVNWLEDEEWSKSHISRFITHLRFDEERKSDLRKTMNPNDVSSSSFAPYLAQISRHQKRFLRQRTRESS